jgi:hypothetical protein
MPHEEITAWDVEPEVRGRLRSYFPDLPQEELDRHAEAICRELRGTPRVPLFWQVDEWPFCCGDLAECIGTWEDQWSHSSSFRCPRCGKEHDVVHLT